MKNGSIFPIRVAANVPLAGTSLAGKICESAKVEVSVH